MKIVTRKVLLQQPSGVLFADYKPYGYVERIAIFGGPQPSGNDFVRAELSLYPVQMPEDQDDWREYWSKHMDTGGEAKPDFECYGRDGMQNPEALYVLLDKEDVQLLFQTIRKCLIEGYGVEKPSDLLE